MTENEITFGTLHPSGELTDVRVIKQSDIMRCPMFILVPDHYRDDGSCKCCAHGCGGLAGSDGYCDSCYADQCLVGPDGLCRYTVTEDES